MINPPKLLITRRLPVPNQTWLMAAALTLLLVWALALPACGAGDTPAPTTATSQGVSVTSPGLASSGAATDPATSAEQSAPIAVVATTPVLADLVGQIAGHRVNIHNLVPADSDVHTWQSTPRDSAHIASADLIISNGARLSPKIADLIKKTVPANTTHVVASAGLVPSELAELDFPRREQDGPDDGHDDEHDDEHGAGDPHFWQNPRHVVHYVNQISNGLVAVDPEHAGFYLDNAAAYIGQLEALDTYIEETLSAIPDQRRVIVTFHDAFGYFGARYGFDVLAFVGRHGGDVAPDDIVSVLELVQHRGLPAVFAEPQFSADALEQVARDAGIHVGVIRSLPDAAYPDYIAMMRANADALAALLR